MIEERDQQALFDVLQTLQVELLTAAKTQVSRSWGETDSVPAYNKLYYICEGAGWIRIDGCDYYPKPGQLFLTPIHSRLSFSALQDQPYLKYWCHFNLLAGPFDLFQWIGVPLCIDVIDHDRMTAVFQELVRCREQRTIAARLREKALLLELVCLFLEQAPVQVLQHRSEQMNRLHVIQQWVEERLHTGITVDQLAEAVHLHPNYFIAYFKKHFGVPPLKYVMRKRKERAMQLLEATSMSIKEVAGWTGFPETNHFTRFFRKETGLSPTEYRAAHATFPAAPIIEPAQKDGDGRN